MANNIWSNYTEKTATPVDTDEVMVRDSTDGKNKRLLFGTFWKWVAKKLNEATISELQTSNKTIIGAINALNRQTILFELGGVNNGSVTTTIDGSKLNSNKHYIVLIAIGHIQGDYSACGIGHFEYARNYSGFSLFKMPGSFSGLDFTFENDGVNPIISITTSSSAAGINASGVITFIG